MNVYELYSLLMIINLRMALTDECSSSGCVLSNCIFYYLKFLFSTEFHDFFLKC